MIDDSSYWKSGLLTLARKMPRWQQKADWSEKDSYDFEKDFFLAAYSIRKLIEAQKLCDAVVTMPVNTTIYPSLGKAVHFMNLHRPHELYDFEKPKAGVLPLDFVCNQLIHSYVFCPFANEDLRIESILFSSDRKRNKVLYQVSLDELKKVFKTVGSDYPNRAHYHFDERKQDYEVHSYCDNGHDFVTPKGGAA